MHVSTFQFENLYAYYSWPNVVLPIIGGELLQDNSISEISILKTDMNLFPLQDNQNNSFEIGYLIDKIFGIRLGAVIFAVFICLGKFEFSIVFIDMDYLTKSIMKVALITKPT